VNDFYYKDINWRTEEDKSADLPVNSALVSAPSSAEASNDLVTSMWWHYLTNRLELKFLVFVGTATVALCMFSS